MVPPTVESVLFQHWTSREGRCAGWVVAGLPSPNREWRGTKYPPACHGACAAPSRAESKREIRPSENVWTIPKQGLKHQGGAFNERGRCGGAEREGGNRREKYHWFLLSHAEINTKSKINQLNIPFESHHDICTLQVTMYKIQAMEILEPLKNLENA